MSIMKSITDDIRKILIRDWDPVGIAEFPEARDEYDGYIPIIERMIEKRGIAEDVARLLLSAEQNMGVEPNTVRALDVAQRLLRIEHIS
jgi:hypothetical protein